MTPDLTTVIYPVKDLVQAKTLFRALLGSEPVMDEPYYVQFTTPHGEVDLDPNGHTKGMSGPVAYWQVDDITATVSHLLQSGATEKQPVSDVGGRLIASVADADGNVIGLVQAPDA